MSNDLSQDASKPLTHPWLESTALRALCALWMVVVPAASFFVISDGLLRPEWHDGSLSGKAAIALEFGLLGWFRSVTVGTIALVVGTLVFPKRVQPWPLRLGLYLAAAMATMYALLLAIASVGISIMMSLGMWPIIYGVSRAALKPRNSERSTWWLVAMVSVGVLVGLLLAIGAVPAQAPSSILLILMAGSGPTMSLAIIVMVLRGTTSVSSPPWAPFIPAALFVATWRHGIQRSIEVYNELPTEPIDCYVATAAARGHHRFVQSTVGPFGTPVNTQLRVLKAGEIVLASSLPLIHRALRQVYDRIGPKLAQRLTRPAHADAAYLVLLPVHLLTHAFLKVVLPNSGAKVVSDIYR